MAAKQLVYQTLRRIGYPLFGQKLSNVQGAENLPGAGGYLIAANHVDFLDGFYISAAVGLARNVPVYFLTASNNYWWTTVAVQIKADRRGAIIDQAVRALTDGKVICNFIEGQRNPATKLLAGRTGTVRMALTAGVPIVPLGIACSAGKNVGQSLMYLMSKNHHVTIKIGRPIRLPAADQPEDNDLRRYTHQVMHAIAPLAGKKI
ncbi:MAG: 1-acyl-sn-glycerol-3-phosphate acyltransferase [Candidatus Kerfeldbacteria bacterium]|nr:1-acyl-sn-glycerol-3-phosphate acyltransferase [Candidatus Kerfeldbacteria bacterium]